MILPNIIAHAEAGAKELLYGIGINRAIINSKVTPTKPFYGFEIAQLQTTQGTSGITVPTFVGNEYNPDASPDGTIGGQGMWDGRMSSMLSGMPVECWLKFVGGTYQSLSGAIITIPDIEFETVLLSLKLGKNIKKTSITGRDTGSVKENISRGDWSVNIRAVISAGQPVNDSVASMNPLGVYPLSNMAEIWKLIQAPIAIPVVCKYLNQFDINYLVIEDGFSVEQIESEYDMQRLVIPCCSDNPLIITIAK